MIYLPQIIRHTLLSLKRSNIISVKSFNTIIISTSLLGVWTKEQQQLCNSKGEQQQTERFFGTVYIIRVIVINNLSI